MRLKLDENLGLSAQAQLHAAGHDVDTVFDEGLAGASDGEVFRMRPRRTSGQLCGSRSRPSGVHSSGSMFALRAMDARWASPATTDAGP